MEIKGHASQNDPKVSWKFKTPSGYDFDMPGLFVEPVDEIDMQADWSDRSHGRAILSWDAYKRAGFADHTMFTVRTQRNGAFQGVYNLQETYDGTWREREGYDDNQFFEAETSAFSTRPVNVQFSKKAPDETDFAPIAAFVNGVRLTGTAQRNYLLGNADLPQMINYAAVTAIIEHHDSSSKNFYLSQDPVTGRWSIIPWDLDHTLGNGCCNVNSNFVTPAEPGDNTSALMRAILAAAPVAGHVLPSAAHAGQRPAGDRTDGGAVRRPGRPRPAGGDARLLGLALPRQPGQLHHLPPAAVQRHRRPPDRVRLRCAGPGQPARRPRHRHRRDPALTHRRQHRRVRGALQPQQPGHRPLRLDHRPAGSTSPSSPAP